MDALIKQSMLDKNVKRTEVLRAIKNEFLVYQTAKGAKPLDDAAEFTILRKMVKQRLDSRDQYISAGRKDLKRFLCLSLSFRVKPHLRKSLVQSTRLSRKRVGEMAKQVPKSRRSAWERLLNWSRRSLLM